MSMTEQQQSFFAEAEDASEPMLNREKESAPFLPKQSNQEAGSGQYGKKSKSSCNWKDMVVFFREYDEFKKLGTSGMNIPDIAIAKQGFYIHWLTVAALVWNWMVVLLVWLEPTASGEKTWTKQFLMSSLYVFGGMYGGWFLWMRPMLQAIGNDSSTHFFWFFLVFLVHTVFSALLALGFPGMSSTGAFVLIEVSKWTDKDGKKYHTTAILCIVSVLLWTAVTIWSALFLRKVHKIYREKGKEGAQEVSDEAKKSMFAAAAAANQSLANSKV